MAVLSVQRILALLAAVTLLSSCGQKGPLYFRDSPPPGVRPERAVPEKPTPYPVEPAAPQGKGAGSPRE